VAGVGILAALFDFMADDAFIVLRYAQNLAMRGALEYNWGEPVNLLTSPLHLFIMIVLNTISTDPMLANKIAGIGALLATLLIGWRSIATHYADAAPRGLCALFQLLFVVIVGLSPFVVLWAVGGLETPYVAFLVTSLTVLVQRAGSQESVSPPTVLLIGILIGIAFLGRFDTALFTAPIVIWLLSKSRTEPWIFAALVPGAVLPFSWLFFSVAHFHDLLPTSFYTKSPTFIPGILARNAAYSLEFFVLSGLLAIGAPPLWRVVRSTARRSAVFAAIRSLWPLWLGLVLFAAYAQTTATVHMMFGFRMFLPYLPTAALLLFSLWPPAKAAEAIGLNAVTVIGATLVVTQVALAFIVNSHSVNPVPGNVAEFTQQSKTEAMKGLATLIASADDIKAHWRTLPQSAERGPRIQGPAAGIVPLRIPNAYVYEVLASQRHKCRIAPELYSDYVQIIAPRLGTPEREFPPGWTTANIISQRQMIFDGELETVMVYFNPRPKPNILPPYIDQPCLGMPAERN
jgi:hypothetical protein